MGKYGWFLVKILESIKGLLGKGGRMLPKNSYRGIGSYCLRRATYAVASQQRKGVASQLELPLLLEILGFPAFQTFA